MDNFANIKKNGLKTQVAIETWYGINSMPDIKHSEVIDGVLKFQTFNFSNDELTSLRHNLNIISLCAPNSDSAKKFSNLLHLALRQQTTPVHQVSESFTKASQKRITDRIGSGYFIEKE